MKSCRLEDMVDPTAVTNFNRTDEELQEFLLFCCAVAGKTAKQISIALDRFLNNRKYYENIPMDILGRDNDVSQEDCSLEFPALPFDKIMWLYNHNMLSYAIKDSKLGQHRKLTNLFEKLAYDNSDLRTCSIEYLEEFKGIGPKTSRYFILHSRKTNDIACLDRHILKYLHKLGHQIPNTAPNGKHYKRLEKAFISHAKELGMTTYDLDLKIWNEYSTRSGKK